MNVLVTRLRAASGWSAALLLCVVAATGCNNQPAKATINGDDGGINAVKKPPRVVIPVEVETPRRGNISEFYETFSRIEAEARVDVSSKGTGRCVKILKEEGDTVEKNEIIAQLDKEEAEANLRQSEVTVRQRLAEFNRAKEGLQSGLISAADYDATRFAYESAVASLELQKVQLDNLTIRAPISGIVQTRMIQVGQLIASGNPVYSIVDPTTYKLVINPPERDRQRLELGQRAIVTIDALQGREFEAVVTRIHPTVDATGTIKVTLGFTDEQREALLESALARVNLIVDTREDVLLLSKDAVIEENARHYVFEVGPLVIPDEPSKDGEDKNKDDSEEEEPEPIEWSMEPTGTANRVEVKVGLKNAESIEIVEGINEDSQIVTLGQANLKDGAAVRATNTEDEIAKNLDVPAEEAIRRAEEKRGNDGGAYRRRMRDRL